MRRAIAAAVMGGLVLGGAAATPALGTARGAGEVPGKLHPATSRATTVVTTASTMKTVVYEGYEFQVPASWPVYRLDEHPQTCVRYDVPAVYLGAPGPDMRCAAGIVGRTQTVSFIPGQDAEAGTGPGNPGQPEAAGGTVLRPLPAVHAAITKDAVRHELSVALGTAKSGAIVLGTYGTDPAVVEQVLSTLRPAPAHAVPATQSGSVPARPGRTQAPTETYTSWRGVPPHWPVEIVQQPAPFHPVGGFDTCTAPSLATMRAWHSDYSDAGVYIGGVNSACAYGNLSASWVRTVTSTWGLLPTYVGPQAPCWGGSGVLIDPGSAAAEGTAAADDAISDMRALDMGAGSPIYYDMEAYVGGTSCTNAVLQFLGAWDRQVAAAGYVTGAYSSQDSGISDLQMAVAEHMAGFTPPDAIWIALWDNHPTLSDGDLAWPLSDRAKQYAGNVTETVGGITLDVDKDIVGGPVAH